MNFVKRFRFIFLIVGMFFFLVFNNCEEYIERMDIQGDWKRVNGVVSEEGVKEPKEHILSIDKAKKSMIWYNNEKEKVGVYSYEEEGSNWRFSLNGEVVSLPGVHNEGNINNYDNLKVGSWPIIQYSIKSEECYMENVEEKLIKILDKKLKVINLNNRKELNIIGLNCIEGEEAKYIVNDRKNRHNMEFLVNIEDAGVYLKNGSEGRKAYRINFWK